jgi:sialate O-acetylesterase
MKKSHFVFVPLFVFISINVLAGIRLPAVISSNMVLQQQSKATLWGWGDPGERIKVITSWNNAIDSVAVTSDGTWSIKVPTPSAGGPYNITLRGWSTVVLENILIGEVWVCSGQSNMEWSSWNNNKQINDEMPKSQNNNIRFFHIPRCTSNYPQDDCDARWEVCGPETLKGFSIVGYFFGKKLNQDMNVPIGLIEAAWGGTPAEVWTPADVIADDAVMKEAAGKLPVTPWGPSLPGKIYNAMIAPITNFDIAGTIWYQGEANVGINSTYQKTFTSMIGAWRNAWHKSFPFYYVQIAPFAYGGKTEGARLMEQQTRSLSYPNTGMVVITDLVENVNDIHPQNKYDVAQRLANLALGQTYQRSVGLYKSPAFRNMEINKNKVTLFFDNAPNGFLVKGPKATEFFIAGEDKNFLPADVKIENDRIVVSSKLVAAPVAVRFSFTNTGISNVFSKEGLPVTPFRTDNWED